MADRQSAMFGLGIAGVWAFGYILFVPVIVIVGMFIGSGILHLCLMIVGGAKKPFETTFRVVCFSSGSTYLLSMIPFCGGMIAGVWNIVLECIGLARAHEIDTGKAVLAVLLPLIVCCGGCIALRHVNGRFWRAESILAALKQVPMRLLWRRRSANEPDHELIWLAVSAASIAGAAVWLGLALPWPRCAFLAVTGLPCVTCGATRSMIALLHGNFLGALRWNPLASLYVRRAGRF